MTDKTGITIKIDKDDLTLNELADIKKLSLIYSTRWAK